MALTLVKKRSGSVVPFASDRIQNAISKAYEANRVAVSDLELDLLVSQVAKELALGNGWKRIANIDIGA